MWIFKGYLAIYLFSLFPKPCYIKSNSPVTKGDNVYIRCWFFEKRLN